MKYNYFSKDLLLIIALLLCSYFLVAQSIEWEKTYGGFQSEIPYSVDQTIDEGFIIAGRTRSDDGDVNNNYGQTDYWVIKIDASGDLEWEKNYGGSSFDIGRSIKQTLDEGYIVAGNSSSKDGDISNSCLLYTSPSPRDATLSRMPSSA